MTFTEDDAALICQTPVSRPAVALLWMLGDWIRRGPVFWALAVTLAFALQDAALGSAVSVEHTPRYVLAGLRVLSVVIPVQWGLMALAWAWGVLRLERDRIRRWWWLGPVGLAVGLLLLLVTSGNGILGGFFRGTSGVVLAPLVFPVATGYGFSSLGGPGGTAAWFPGLLAGLGWGLVGSLALGLAARPLNLGRAAQESTGRAASEAAAQAGNAQAAAEIALRQRLGTGHPPTRLAGRPGGQALAWKSALELAAPGRVAPGGTAAGDFFRGSGHGAGPGLGYARLGAAGLDGGGGTIYRGAAGERFAHVAAVSRAAAGDTARAAGRDGPAVGGGAAGRAAGAGVERGAGPSR